MSFEDDMLSLNGPQYHRDHSSSFGDISWTSLQRSRLDSTNCIISKGLARGTFTKLFIVAKMLLYLWSPIEAARTRTLNLLHVVEMQWSLSWCHAGAPLGTAAAGDWWSCSAGRHQYWSCCLHASFCRALLRLGKNCVLTCCLHSICSDEARRRTVVELQYRPESTTRVSN